MGHGMGCMANAGDDEMGDGGGYIEIWGGIVFSAPLGGVGGYIEIWGREGRRLY